MWLATGHSDVRWGWHLPNDADTAGQSVRVTWYSTLDTQREKTTLGNSNWDSGWVQGICGSYYCIYSGAQI